jgi:hypothetical protein
VTTF